MIRSLLLTLTLATVASGVSYAAAPVPVSFANDVLPILQANCVSCHLTGDEAGKMALAPKSAYASLVGFQSTESPNLRVKPGAPDESYIMMKLEGTQHDHGGMGVRMPFGQPQLDQPTRDTIRSWIAQGAQNN